MVEFRDGMPINKTYRGVLDQQDAPELTLEIPSFAGGENTIGQDQELKANEARTIENWDSDSLGGMVRSKGFTSIATGLGGVDSYTVLMLHMNGADGSTTFTDSSPNPHTFTAQGNAQIDTAQYVFGGSSGLFDGSGDYITSPDSNDWNLGAGDFTISFRVRFAALTAGTFPVFIGQYDITGQRNWETYFDVDTNRIYFDYSTDGSSTTSRFESWSPVINTWYAVRIVRSGSTLLTFINGTKLSNGNSVSGTFFNSTAVLSLGVDLNSGSPVAGDYLNGWLDEVKLDKGIARNTANYTVETDEFTNTSIAADGVLHHFEGTSTRNYVINNGDLFRINGSSLTHTDSGKFTAGVLTHGLSAGNKAWFTNSTDNLKYTTIAGSVTVPTTVPPNARDRIYLHKSRLVAEGGGVTVYGSKAGSGTWAGAGGWTTSGDAWSIDLPDLTQGCVPGFPSGPEITVFTKFKAYSLYNMPNIAFREILGSHGCSAPYSIAQGTEGVFLFSLYPTLGVWLWDGVNWVNLTVNEDWVNQVSLTNRCFGIYSENKYRFFYNDNTSGVSYPNVLRTYDARWGRWMKRSINSSVGDTFGIPMLLTKANNELYVGSSQVDTVYQLEDTSNSDNTYNTQANYVTKDFTSKDFGADRDEIKMKLLKCTVTYYGSTGNFSLLWNSDRGLHTGSQTFDLTARGDLINTTFTVNTSYISQLPPSKTITRSFGNGAVGRRFNFQILNSATGDRCRIKNIKISAIALQEV
jgi:hypothetical protein